MTTTRVPGLDYDEQALVELCQRWQIRELRLFGSQARAATLGRKATSI